MSIIKIIKILIGVLSLLITYLVIVGIWASLSVKFLLPQQLNAVSPTQLSSEQKDILLKIEDPRFYDHIGVDLSLGQGVTTITSSLAASLFLNGQDLPGIKGGFQGFYRRAFNCCKKIDFGRDVMAVVLNANMSKEQQLALFVSSAYLVQLNKRAVAGFAAAAEGYFHKPLVILSRDEFVALVAMLKGPNYYHPLTGAEPLKRRVARIKQILSGACVPSGWFDTLYAQCDS